MVNLNLSNIEIQQDVIKENYQNVTSLQYPSYNIDKPGLSIIIIRTGNKFNIRTTLKKPNCSIIFYPFETKYDHKQKNCGGPCICGDTYNEATSTQKDMYINENINII